MRRSRVRLLALSLCTALALPALARAQRVGENAVTSADDAFGTNVGLETSGIYSENDTRGFSPTKAGNVRYDGIYADPIGSISGRLRASTAIRVGFSAEEYPFHAPTGIVDHKFRPFSDDLGLSQAFHETGHGGNIIETDFRVPLIKSHLSVHGGTAFANSHLSDGSGNHAFGYTVRSIIRFGGVELAPFWTRGGFRQVRSRVLAVVSGDDLPKLPESDRYLGQDWARGRSNNGNYGFTAKAALTGRLSLRGGLFKSLGPRLATFTEIYTLQDPGGQARHRLIADPEQDVHSLSGEVQLAYRLSSGRWQHRFFAGFRGRNRYTETGGSVVRSYAEPVTYGQPDPRPEDSFAFGPVNAGRVEQSSFMVGYTGRIDGLGIINLGIQKARFRGTARDGRSGQVTVQHNDPWLYNATLGVDLTPHLSAYFGTERGLEDSGVAPENAVNRNEQMPATLSTQYEGGLRWKFPQGQLVVNAFQIEKPYFSLDSSNIFTQIGNVRHRGIETSITGHFGKRFSLVGGAVALQARVTGGLRPVATPSFFARLDANYRTDIFGGLTPTLTLLHTGSRAVSTRAVTAGGEQLTVPGFSTIDIGLRHQFKVGKVPASLRFVVNNVFDTATWKVAAANTLFPDERRKLNLSVSADF